MNRPTHKTVITFEKFQRTIVRTRHRSRIDWCERCQAEAATILPDEAARGWGTNERDIIRQIENGARHFIELPTGELLVCGGLQRKVNNETER